MTNSELQITPIRRLNKYTPICNYQNPICNSKPVWACGLDEIESQYFEDYIRMNLVRTLRQTIEKVLGKDSGI